MLKFLSSVSTSIPIPSLFRGFINPSGVYNKLNYTDAVSYNANKLNHLLADLVSISDTGRKTDIHIDKVKFSSIKKYSINLLYCIKQNNNLNKVNLRLNVNRDLINFFNCIGVRATKSNISYVFYLLANAKNSIVALISSNHRLAKFLSNNSDMCKFLEVLTKQTDDERVGENFINKIAKSYYFSIKCNISLAVKNIYYNFKENFSSFGKKSLTSNELIGYSKYFISEVSESFKFAFARYKYIKSAQQRLKVAITPSSLKELVIKNTSNIFKQENSQAIFGASSNSSQLSLSGIYFGANKSKPLAHYSGFVLTAPSKNSSYYEPFKTPKVNDFDDARSLRDSILLPDIPPETLAYMKQHELIN